MQPPMQQEGGATRSYWVDSVTMPHYPRLQNDREVDVCIVGAGLGGLTTAYLLARAGKKVIVLDDGPVGGGETSRTTAHLASEIDDRYSEIERMHGAHNAQIAAESQIEAINMIERIVRDEKIDCDFLRVPGFLFLDSEDEEGVLEEEFEAANKAGVRTEWCEDSALEYYDVGISLRFPNQAQFHPLKYLAALARIVVERGGEIFCDSHVDGVKGGSTCEVTLTGGHTVKASSVVVATNTPVNDWVVMHTKQAPYRTYVVAYEIEKGKVAPGLYWTTGDPYHYVRIQPIDDARDLLIVGGEDHKTGQPEERSSDKPEDRFGCLDEWTRERFPFVTDPAYRWSGQVMEPVDALAFLGKDPVDENVYLITGDSGMGMTNTTAGAMIIYSLIMGRTQRWAALYDPARKSLSSAGEFIKENANVAREYTDWLKRGDVASVDEIPVGEGAVMNDGLQKVAVYKDEQGVLSKCSAVCTHLQCIVRWNSVEKSFDCPCHGSRFDPYGRVMNGPAIRDLERLQ